MMTKYQLLNKEKRPISITIDESAKEDFKKLMNWSEEEFLSGTIISETSPKQNLPDSIFVQTAKELDEEFKHTND